MKVGSLVFVEGKEYLVTAVNEKSFVIDTPDRLRVVNNKELRIIQEVSEGLTRTNILQKRGY